MTAPTGTRPSSPWQVSSLLFFFSCAPAGAKRALALVRMCAFMSGGCICVFWVRESGDLCLASTALLAAPGWTMREVFNDRMLQHGWHDTDERAGQATTERPSLNQIPIKTQSRTRPRTRTRSRTRTRIQGPTC